MILQRAIKPTLTPFELNPGDQLALTLGDGRLWEMKLLGATAEVVARGFDRYRDDGHAGSDITVYAFEATVLINGNEHRMRREVGSQRAFFSCACSGSASIIATMAKARPVFFIAAPCVDAPEPKQTHRARFPSGADSTLPPRHADLPVVMPRGRAGAGIAVRMAPPRPGPATRACTASTPRNSRPSCTRKARCWCWPARAAARRG